jgi:3-dehydroquinate synthase
MNYCQVIIKTLIERNIKKNDVLIAIGGGIIQDINGFIASILFRGIDWHFYPTTLLAQADSCIGSKSSINIGEYKNQIGTFYPPSQIISDVGFLETLPVAEIKSGIGEILHFFFIAGSDLLVTLSDNYEKLLRKPQLLKHYIQESLGIKKKIVEIDEFDKDKRNLFNYGHTFGHAIEAISDYSIPHGQAVTMGMDIANFISLHLKYLNKDIYDLMHQILAKNMPAFKLVDAKMDDYIKFLSKDKKNVGNNLVCILSSGPGAMHKTQVPLNDKLKEMISAYFNTYD